MAIALREYGGAPPEGGFGTVNLVLEHPRLQVVCRGAVDDYVGPRAKAEAIYRYLATRRCVTLSGTFYHGLLPQQTPFPIRRDRSGGGRSGSTSRPTRSRQHERTGRRGREANARSPTGTEGVPELRRRALEPD